MPEGDRGKREVAREGRMEGGEEDGGADRTEVSEGERDSRFA